MARAKDGLPPCDSAMHADWEILDLCADALHYALAAEKALKLVLNFPIPLYPPQPGARAGGGEDWRTDYRRLEAAHAAARGEVVSRLRRAKKMKAATPAGIYAKALLVRCSKTGAVELAMSLATDLVDCGELREILWPPGPVLEIAHASATAGDACRAVAVPTPCDIGALPELSPSYSWMDRIQADRQIIDTTLSTIARSKALLSRGRDAAGQILHPAALACLMD